MPHQCLKCGEVFEDGSPQLLKGCPNCNGNRFFYTRKALDSLERERIQKEIGEDINEQLVTMLGEHSDDIMDHAGNWVTMKPKDIRKALSSHIKENSVISSIQKTDKNQKDKPIQIDAKYSQYTLVEDETYRKQQLDRCKPKEDRLNHPETIGIKPPGEYEIDIKGLLENQPIIIEKDGSYTIHLPSAFKQFQKKTEK